MATKKSKPIDTSSKNKMKEVKHVPGQNNPSMPEEYEEQLSEKIRMVPQPLKKADEKKKKKN